MAPLASSCRTSSSMLSGVTKIEKVTERGLSVIPCQAAGTHRAGPDRLL
jgi:hypothetical protein